MGAAAQLKSFDELYLEVAALPQGEAGEILGPGWARTMSRPGAAHARAAKRVLRLFGPFDLDNGGTWWIEAEREIRLPGDRLFVPDLAGWHAIDVDLAFLDDNPIGVRPDWACEILSRSTQRGDRVVKLPTYAAAGVGHTWILDIEAETIEVYAPRDGHPLLVATASGSNPTALPPFDLPIDVTALLAPPRSTRR